jgi:AcrR family transcriptional regulator
MMTHGREVPVQATEMVGRRELNKQRRRERILDAAFDLLRQHSHESVTLERIACRAEVAEMTIFNLIGNRAQIWAALAERALAEVDLASVDADDPHQRAVLIAEGVTGVLIAEPHVFRAVLRSWTAGARVVLGDPMRVLVDCFAEAVQRGSVVPDLDVRAAAELLSAALLGVAHEWAAEAITDTTLTARARDMVDIVFAAARPAGPPTLRIRTSPGS